MYNTSIFEEYRPIIDAVLNGKTIQLVDDSDCNSDSEIVKWRDL